MTETWFGLLVGSQRRLHSAAKVYEAVRGEAKTAVQAGITTLVAPEHLEAEPYSMLRPWPMLAALRAALPSFEAVGSVIAGLASPAQLCGDLRTISAIGVGPVGVALAAGYRQNDFTSADRRYEDRFRLRSELRRELSSQGSVPSGLLWSAASNVSAACRANRDGAQWYCAPTTSERTVTEIRGVVGVGGVLRRDVIISDSRKDLRQKWDRYVAPKYGAYAQWGYVDSAEHVLAGSAAQIIDRLGSLIAAAQPLGIVLRLCWPDMDGSSGVDHVQAFAQEVLPAVRPQILPTPRRSM